MSLVANAVDPEAIGLDKLDDSHRACSLVAVVLKVVVIVFDISVCIKAGDAGKHTVKLSMLVVLGCQSESDRDKSFSDGVVPHA
jgi:hypothetical protein